MHAHKGSRDPEAGALYEKVRENQAVLGGGVGSGNSQAFKTGKVVAILFVIAGGISTSASETTCGAKRYGRLSLLWPPEHLIWQWRVPASIACIACCMDAGSIWQTGQTFCISSAMAIGNNGRLLTKIKVAIRQSATSLRIGSGWCVNKSCQVIHLMQYFMDIHKLLGLEDGQMDATLFQQPGNCLPDSDVDDTGTADQCRLCGYGHWHSQ